MPTGRDIIEKYIKDNAPGSLFNGKTLLDTKTRILPISPALDTITGGIPEGSWVNIAAQPKQGKMQPLYSSIITPNGPKLMGNICIGDDVCGENGNIYKVTNIFEHKDKDIYRIHFQDGDFVDCGLEHLWYVKGWYRNHYEVKTTEDIMNDTKTSDARYKWAIDLPSPTLFYTQSLPLHPYLLGCLLGDGGLTGSEPRFTNVDNFIINKVNKNLPANMFIKQISNSITYRFYSYGEPNMVRNHLIDLGLMFKNSHQKFIPNIYKYSDVTQRITLIQGLMDTDGTIANDGECEYSTVSLQLAQDFKEVINSLGGLCSIRTRHTKCNGKSFLSYRCRIRYDKELPLFTLPRKVDRIKLRIKKPIQRRISKIEKLQDKQDCRCISVDNPSQLYLTDNHIITHNTTLTLHICAKAQKPEYGGKQIYYMNIEGRLKKMNLLGIKGLDLDKFHVISSTEDKILSSSDYLNIAEQILLNEKEIILVLDSPSSLVPDKEIQEGVGAETRGNPAKLMAQFCRQMGQIVPIRKHIIVGIFHVMANTSGWGGPTFIQGGNAAKYQADIILTSKGAPQQYKENEKIVGQIVTWECQCSALGFPPGGAVESYLRYGEGIDELAEMISIGKSIGLITGKVWLYPTFLTDHPELTDNVKLTAEQVEEKYKFQGAENLCNAFKANEAWQKALSTDILKIYKG